MDKHLKALHDTLKAAADSNSNAIIRPKEAREGAKAIERLADTGPREQIGYSWDV